MAGSERLRRELESELAAGPARARDAEIALAETGTETPVRLAAAIRALLWHRRPDATICPSDAARAVGGDSWRDLMDTAREVAAGLAGQGVIVVRRRGADVDITTVTGPVRLARGPAW
jgi:hypothetical protein